MPAQLMNAAVVITAVQLNPSIFTPPWVSKHLDLSDEEFRQGSAVFTPTVANLTTPHFNLLVLPDRLQCTLIPPESEGALVRKAILTIVDALPHTPYTAVGLNFDWHLFNDRMLSEVTRKLFFSDANWLCREFTAPDACFGVYVSRDYAGCRLKLTVLPHRSQKMVDGVLVDGPESVQFSFNFNLDLYTGDRPKLIKGMVDRWDEVRVEAARIIDLATKELG
jgi:hypothetical protein